MTDDAKPTIFYGVATVGERGQVVIPADARRLCAIEPGDKLMFLSHPSGRAVLMARVSDVLTMLDEIVLVTQMAHRASEEPEDDEGGHGSPSEGDC